jgi:hypothetical protein
MNEAKLVFAAWLLSGVFLGLIQLAGGQLLWAVREIALNTRAASRSPSVTQYGALRALGGILMVFGGLTIAATIWIGFEAVKTSRHW